MRQPQARPAQQWTALEPPRLQRAIENIVTGCLGIHAGEDVLVIADVETQLIAERLRDAARATGAEVVLASMDPRACHGSEPPRTIASAILECDAYLAPTTCSLSHTRARARASTLGVRGATLPGVTAEVLARLMTSDLGLLARRSRAVADALSAGHTAELSCPCGSRMSFDLSDRRAVADDGDLSVRGAFGNLPCGEAFIAPKSGEGVIVAASIASLGLSDPRATLRVRDGRLVAADGGLGPALLDALRSHGDAGRNLAELGVGTNDHATLTGNVLEDEKLLGSVHVAFGSSVAIGGTVAVAIHLDVIVTDATLSIDGRQILDAGRLMLDTSPGAAAVG